MHLFKYIPCLCLCFALFPGVEARSQVKTSMPALAKDPTITVGTLPNGMSYYFDVNKSGDGMISLSLVQKQHLSISRKELVKRSREHFSSIRFGHVAIEDILARNDVLPGNEGFIIAEPGSVEYRFSDISMARSAVAIDSLLLSVFKLAALASDCGTASADQAVIVAGDFDKTALLTKLTLLSLLVDKVPGKVVQPEYVWDPSVNKKNSIVQSGTQNVKLSLEWYGSRLPAEYMKTILPVVSGKMNGELAYILYGRLYPAFQNANLDAVVRYKYLGSGDVATDECSRLSVYCAKENSNAVRDILSKEISRLATYGVDDVEYAYARDSYKFSWMTRARAADPSDMECVSKCKSAFLFGTGLATEAEKMRFLYRDIPDTTQTRQFNNWMRPILLQCTKPDMSLSPVPPMLSRIDIATRVNSYFNTSITYKAPKDAPEYVGGGQMCTFPNGLNFAYKKLDTDGMIYYAYAAKGGRQWAEMENLMKIEGVSTFEWNSYLSSIGITMVPHLDASNVVLKGKVPSDKLPELLAALAALTKQPCNSKVFGSTCYKFLTIVADADYAAVKKTVLAYAPALGYGAPWKSVDAFQAAQKSRMLPDDIIFKNVELPLDLSAENYALSEVCRYVLQEALATAFKGCAVSYFQNQYFVGFPTWNYNITYGVRRCSLEGFALSEKYLDDKEINFRLNEVLRQLATTEISQERLHICRQMASNAFDAYSKTADYYVDAITQRYLDNKNIYQRHTSFVARVSSSAVREFFAKAR